MKPARKLLLALFLLPLVAAAQPAWLDDGLVAYYPFDGNPKDTSGNGYGGSLRGATLANDRFDSPSKAYAFTEDTGMTLKPMTPISSGNPRTISIWVKNSNTYRAKPIVYGELISKGALALQYDGRDDNPWNIWTHGADTPYAEAGPMRGEWAHHVITYDGDELILFINGDKASNKLGVQLATSETDVYIGMPAPFDVGAIPGFVGSLDDIRFYNRALSATEVTELYEYESTPPAPKPIEEWIDDGLVAYYRFDGDAKDYSGNGNHGVFVGDIQSAENRFGVSVGALSFPGAPPNHVEISSTAELQFAASNQGTISFWMLLGDFSGRKHIMGARPGGDWRYQIMVEGDSIDFFGTGQPEGASLTTGLANLEVSAWHHYVYSVTSESTELYVDGLQLDKVEGNTLGVVTDFVFTIGNVGNPGSPNDFDDSLDDIRFYNRALSAFEVSQLYAYELNLKLPARADATVVAGFVVGTNILSPGRGYNNQPEVKFIGGNPVEEAQAEAIIEDARLIAINITNAGSGYQSEPSIRIESPPSQALLSIGISKIETIVPESERPRRAIATANVINGFLVSADIVDGGAGYEQAPIVTVNDATGTGALAAATIENGVVTSVQFVKAGKGYSDKALIQFQSPQPNPEATPRVTEVEVSMQMAFPNNYYIIEASSDLVSWEQVVEPFFAEETTHTVKVAVGDDDMRYFRAIQLP